MGLNIYLNWVKHIFKLGQTHLNRVNWANSWVWLCEPLVLLPLLDLMESPLFTTLFPWMEKFLSLYNSSAPIVLLGKLQFLSLCLGTSRRLPRNCWLGDKSSPQCDALRVERPCSGMLSFSEDCSNFSSEDDFDIDGVIEQWLGRREESLSEGFSKITSGAGTMMGICIWLDWYTYSSNWSW